MPLTRTRVIAVLAGLAAAGLPAVAAAQEGADEDSALEEILGGFEDAAEETLDDILGGFDDDGEDGEVGREVPAERWWDLTGSVETSASFNYRKYESATGRNFRGLSRFRNRLNLQADLDLPFDWRGRVAGFGFYDATYAIRGRGSYTNALRDDYEWEVDFQEVWLQGSLLDDLDAKVGRQVINWGRSDTLRILDILNPLDNREPGRVDIEDLRRPVTMARLDYYLGDWSLTAVAVPELRFGLQPRVGSDFNPSPIGIPRDRPDPSLDNTEWAGRINGIFQGWDVSFQAARYWADASHFAPRRAAGPKFVQLKHARLWMVGSGGNYTRGSWLFKYELGYFDGLEFGKVRSSPMGLVQKTSDSKSRLDTMAGVEYYGFTDVTIAVEFVNRHLFDYDSLLGSTPAPPAMPGPPTTAIKTNLVQRNRQETAIRYTADFWNQTLQVTALALVFGERAQHGAVVRLSADYDVRDALVVSGGILLFEDGEGSTPPVDAWSRNDRLFLSIKYSF